MTYKFGIWIATEAASWMSQKKTNSSQYVFVHNMTASISISNIQKHLHIIIG